MKIGIQGTPGSYHEQVAHNYFGVDADIEYMDTFKQVFDGLREKTIGQAVVAIANNRYGFVPDAFNQLISRHHEVRITGESYLRVQHQLMGVRGASLDSIKEVHSQAPALGQCQLFLEKYLPHVTLIEQEDTAKSARIVADRQDPSLAAIASNKAADLHKLEIIEHNIQDDKDNFTRFLILKNHQQEQFIEGANKTTTLLKVSQDAGSLARALMLFAVRQVNISALHSSFLPNTGFDMQFLLEFDTDLKDSRTLEIFTELQKQDVGIEVMGSYVSAVNEMNA